MCLALENICGNAEDGFGRAGQLWACRAQLFAYSLGKDLEDGIRRMSGGLGIPLRHLWWAAKLLRKTEKSAGRRPLIAARFRGPGTRCQLQTEGARSEFIGLVTSGGRQANRVPGEGGSRPD